MDNAKASGRKLEYVFGEGYDCAKLKEKGKDCRHRKDLDAISTEIPIYLVGFDHHSVLVNTRAMINAGIINKDGKIIRDQIAGGFMYRDEKGNLNGVFAERATSLLQGPGLVIDGEGRKFLYTNRGNAVELNADGTFSTGEVQHVYDGWDFPQDWEVQGKYLESPKLFKRGDYYYLVSAEGGTAGPATSHMCIVARSRSALGPWENSPYNPLVHTYSAEEEWWSKGHGTIFDDADGNWYIVYHAYRKGYISLGRATIIEGIEWTEDGWPKLASDRNDFEEDRPGSAQYDALRDYTNPLLWAEWGRGFDGARLWHFTAVDTSYSITAEFLLTEGAKAGLYLFYNENLHLGVQDTAGHFFVKITNKEQLATVEKSYDGENWTVTEKNVDVSGYNHNACGGFAALHPSIMLSDGVQVKDFKYIPIQR